MVLTVSLTLFWAVLTPLVAFLVFLPGYVLVAYIRHRYNKIKTGKTTRLINKERITPYYAEIRPILIERLQKRSSLNIPPPITSGAKPSVRKHLRSSSTQLTGSPIKSRTTSSRPPCILQSPYRHIRRNSSPVSVSQQRMEILEPYTLYQVQPSYSSQEPFQFHSTEIITEVSPPGHNKSGGKSGKSRHLPSQGAVPNKLRFSPTGQTSPLGEGKPELPEILEK